MNSSSRLRIFPWATLFTGIVGLALRCWLFSSADKKGLLPHDHIAEVLCFVLLAITLGLCLLVVRRSHTATSVPASNIAVAGSIAGSLAIVLSGLFPAEKTLFPLLTCAFSIVVGCALLFDAYCRLKGKAVSPVAHYIAMSFMILRIMFFCRSWSGETQIQRFVFELFAALLFLLTLYYRAQLSIAGTGHKQYLFFSQAALYCFCLCLANTDFLFSLGAGMWLATETLGLSETRGECV